MKLKQWIARISKALHARLVSVSSLKLQFRAGAYGNCFTITPCLQITYSEYYRSKGFAIEMTWGKWGVGVRFYYKKR